MKRKKYLLLCCLGLAFLQSQAQFASPETLSHLLDIPVLTGETRSSIIPANAGILCFDRLLELTSVDELGRELETNLYINSRLGYIGYDQHLSGISTGSIRNPDVDGFRFTLITLEGNTYVYLNSISSGQLKKRVITHHSDFYHTSVSGFMQPGSLQLTTETGTYGHHRGILLQTKAYAAGGGETKYYLAGNNFPASLSTNARSRYLGIGGVGFIFLDNKVYLSMAMRAGNKELTRVNIVRIEEHCFDTAPYVNAEDELYEKRMVRILKEREKIRRATVTSGPCASHDLTIKNFRLSMLNREELWLEKSVSGNLLDNPVAREAIFNLNNYEDQLQLMIYEQERKICETEADIARGRSGNASLQQKLECYRRQYGQMQANLTEMRTLNTRYPGDEGRQLMEKARLMFRVEGCN